MEYIVTGNNCCAYLNHQQIIEDLYRKYANPNGISYSLKEELFNFKPKVRESLANSQNSKPIKNSKRKRKAETEYETENVNENPLKEKFDLQPFLNKIQQNLKQLHERISENIPRLWEDQQEFPQFRGANQTKEFQITKLCSQDYIIPPYTKFFNYDIKDLPKLLPELETYDIIVMDMPWHNKYIRRLKKVKSSLAYQMLDNETLKKMPITDLLHNNSLVVIWCTNALQHRLAIEKEFLPGWNLQLVHTIKWFKINTLGDLISPPKPEGYKQPYELVYIACHKDRNLQDLKELSSVDFLISIPSIIHSHKPPLTELMRKFLPNSEEFKGLEIFARYLQPHFTSIGLEVLKLMDKRLYVETK